jgi:rubrerythrin
VVGLLERSGLVEVEDLAWERVGSTALDPDAIACLLYMRDVEGFTDRDLVGAVAHPNTLGDPLLRRFLDVWRAEEAAHARAIDRYLRTYASRRDTSLPAQQPPPPAVMTREERLLLQLTRPVGHVVTAAHMVWGAANELLTMHGYCLLSRRSADPVLGELLRRIAAQESRHYSFYALQAEWRLAASRLARRALPAMMRTSWTPVGIGDQYKTAEEFGRVLTYLAADEHGRRAVDRMDATFTRLPGFDGLQIYRRAVEESALSLAA